MNLGQGGKGALVEFSIQSSQLSSVPGYLGGSGNAGRIVTGGAPFSLSVGSNPRYVR